MDQQGSAEFQQGSRHGADLVGPTSARPAAEQRTAGALQASSGTSGGRVKDERILLTGDDVRTRAKETGG